MKQTTFHAGARPRGRPRVRIDRGYRDARRDQASVRAAVHDVAQAPAFGAEEVNVVRVARQYRQLSSACHNRKRLRLGCHRAVGRLILTNAHVVGMSRTVRVGLADGRRVERRVVGRIRRST